MTGYVNLREYAKKYGISVAKVFEMGRENNALKTINEGNKANIYINLDVLNIKK